MTERQDRVDNPSARNSVADQDSPDPQFDAMTSRLIRREALRRAAEEVNTMSGPGLEQTLARVSDEVTEDAVYRRAQAGRLHAAPIRKQPGPL
jgi:hypothetical protein